MADAAKQNGPESQTGGGSQYTEAELDSLIDWIAEVIAEQRLQESQSDAPISTLGETQEDPNEHCATSQQTN